MRITITANISPTEDPERVRQAIRFIFPDATEEAGEESVLIMVSEDIQPLITRILEQKIRDAARGVLLKSILGSSLTFHLNKQAAFTGKVNFTDGRSPLGDLEVTFSPDEPVEWVHSMLGRPE